MDVARHLALRGPPTRGDTLKADPESQQRLLDVQRHDSSLAQLRRRRSTLPETARLEELAKAARELDGRRIEAETLVGDLTREQKRADADVEQVRARRVRDQERLDSGQVTSPKDLENLQHEIVALDRRIGTLEDAELEVMEQLEEAQGDLTRVRAETEDNERDTATTTTSRDRALTSIEEESAAVGRDREQAAGLVPAELLALYDKVAAQQGTGAAALRQRRCEGCRLELNGADIRELKERAADDVLRCPECNRILVRVEDSGL